MPKNRKLFFQNQTELFKTPGFLAGSYRTFSYRLAIRVICYMAGVKFWRNGLGEVGHNNMMQEG